MKKTKRSSSSKGSKIDREQYLNLTTRGRATGRPREIEIWFTERDGRYYVIAEYDTSHWLQNLRVHPAVQVRVAGKTFAAHARVLSAGGDGSDPDAALRDAVQDFSRTKYGWGDGTVVELAPDP